MMFMKVFFHSCVIAALIAIQIHLIEIRKNLADLSKLQTENAALKKELGR